ncbi:hypothetical protein PPL_09664 [Heterostelium album PN500]|uniref:Uncharacterized protein n=1 Tax=Heterostelium pallidum (strain ATCC 26659 / Pp 5 / PN500) TaxID=670386 RepID=D3BNG1_HETP5|nr:hypothetical protein PPL_09664 [Heterostelium album PN500]EFA76912.1 hypothetical protein PPL_09664 [Heterostelium album PN500]|eukprot:XP_020429044.1 hypothetical protein PPL_09664 [Heterostelium album PN500]
MSNSSNHKRKNTNYNNGKTTDIEESRKKAKSLHSEKLRFKINDNNNKNNTHSHRRSSTSDISNSCSSSGSSRGGSSSSSRRHSSSGNSSSRKKDDEESVENYKTTTTTTTTTNYSQFDLKRDIRNSFYDYRSGSGSGFGVNLNKEDIFYGFEDEKSVKQNIRQLASSNPSEMTPFLRTNHRNNYVCKPTTTTTTTTTSSTSPSTTTTSSSSRSTNRNNNSNSISSNNNDANVNDDTNNTLFDFPSCFPQCSNNLYIDGALSSFQPLIKFKNEIRLKLLTRPYPLSINNYISPLWFEEHFNNNINNNSNNNNNNINDNITTTTTTTTTTTNNNINDKIIYKNKILEQEGVPAGLLQSILKEEEKSRSISLQQDRTSFNYGNTMLNIKDKLLVFASGSNMNVLTLHSLISKDNGVFPLKYQYDQHALHYYNQPQTILNIDYYKYSKYIYLIYFRTLYSVYFFYLRYNNDNNNNNNNSFQSKDEAIKNSSLEFINKTTFKDIVSDVCISSRSLEIAYVLLSDGSLLSLNYQAKHDYNKYLKLLLKSGGDHESLRIGEWKKLRLSRDTGIHCYIACPTELIAVEVYGGTTETVQCRLLMNHLSYGLLTGFLMLDHFQMVVTTSYRSPPAARQHQSLGNSFEYHWFRYVFAVWSQAVSSATAVAAPRL